ncbi:LacI family transcriptional regulator [Vibrio sp. DW001]|uniref:LacI family DNA-binding transcriptional regulator n=1 Tax=Vibrio sp. DW001 TaxID=2912315 RepID=UPI0023AFE6DC|nr:LacI family DNA-binding transcriptional regulator [Vibrio sp. DW001]WED29370.1 LacI family transcriptional regulator [Vibrio sp. DW001]
MDKKIRTPTLADVATLAGVSKAVASRALSGKNRPISADKKTRVLQAAETLGYVANPFAQSLANNETGLVAIVVNHISDVSDLTLFDSLIQSIQAIGKRALFVRLKSLDDIKALQKNSFVQYVDAALIFSDLIEPTLAESLFFTNNIIMLNGKSQQDGYSVKVNEEPGILSAVHYAQSIGVTRAILIAGRQSSVTEKQRVSHYLQQFNANEIELISSTFCNYSYDDALNYLQSSDISDSSNLGVFCTSDSMAMAAVDYFNLKALPHNHCIFGFDNTEFSRRGNYQFSTIGYNKHDFVQAIISIVDHVQSSQGININHKETDNRKWLPLKESHWVIETQFYLNNLDNL